MRLPDRSQLLTAICWLVAAVFVGWSVVRTFGLESGYPAVPLIAYTPYVALLSVPVAVVLLLLRRRPAAAVTGLTSVLLILAVAPRALPDDPPDPRPSGPGLSVLAANLLGGGADLAPLIDQVTAGDVDVVSFSELTPEAEARINASELGELLPNQVSTPIGGASGTGLYSRYPMRRLPAPGVEGNDLPTVIASLELPDGGSAEVYSIHPYPPTGEHEVAGLRRYLDAIPPAEPEGPPRLLIGDFNSTLDNAMLRDVLDRGYTDAAAAAGDGLSWTWPQRLYPPPVTIDHVIVDERVEVLEYQTHELPGSDHRMVLAGLRLPGTEQVAPAP